MDSMELGVHQYRWHEQFQYYVDHGFDVFCDKTKHVYRHRDINFYVLVIQGHATHVSVNIMNQSFLISPISQTESPHNTIIPRAAMMRGFQYVRGLLAAISMQRDVCRPGCIRKGKRSMRRDTPRIGNVSTFCQRKEHRGRSEISSVTGNMELSSKAMLRHWGRDKMIVIFQTTFSIAFSWMNMYKFRLRFHWSMSPRDQLTLIFQQWLR